jgi:hypothetical protein
MLQEIGFLDVQVSKAYDVFAQARGEKNARRFEVYGYTFMACKPG